MIRHRFTDRRDGDLAIDADPTELAARRAALTPHPWTSLRQVHGATVRVVTRPGEHRGAEGDALVTAVPGAAIAVQTADCGAILLDGGAAVGVVHAGWQGLRAGVIGAAASAMADLGSPPVAAVLGPVIRPRCYEFDGPALQELVDRYGERVRATTAWGTPALDLAASVAAACEAAGIPALADAGTCTACSPVHWSHRARADIGRQALVAWIEP